MSLERRDEMTISAATDTTGIEWPTGPFAAAAPLYRAVGWLGTIHLPVRAKEPPPTGYTGHPGRCADDDTIAEWIDLHPNANIAIWLGFTAIVDGQAWEVIGIDVDHYVSGDRLKRGGELLAELERQLGPLPETVISSSRDDTVSGIRFFRVPPGLHWRDPRKADGAKGDIEIIWRGHCYAVVWPSIHPEGRQYHLYPRGCRPDGVSFTDQIPDAAALPVLPDVWVDHLTQNRIARTDRPIDMDASDDEVNSWADETFNDGDAAAMCAASRRARDRWAAAIASEPTSHDKIRDAHWEIFNLAGEGHTGWVGAVNEIEKHWADDVVERDKRGSELYSEVYRSRLGALRKVKAMVEQAAEIGAHYTPSQCTCVTPTSRAAHQPAYRRAYRPAYRRVRP